MKIPPLKIKYTKLECSSGEEQQVLDDAFDLLFNFITANIDSNNYVVRDLTITGV